MVFFKSKADFAPGEREVLGLLLAGKSEFYARLRKQCEQPFLLTIERTTKPRRFTITLIYDASLELQYWLGESVSMKIDDVVIFDRRVQQPIQVKAIVHQGVLGNVLFATSDPVRWPKRITVDEWFYVSPDGERTKERRVDWEHAALRPSPLSSAAIPADYREYLEDHNPLNLQGTNLLRADEVYELDEQPAGHSMLVFGRALDGSVLSFSLDEAQDGLMPVFLIERETGHSIKLANSFTDWLASGAALL